MCAIGEDTIACYESSSGRYFLIASEDELTQIVADLNEMLDKTGRVSMNDIYNKVGLNETEAGNRFGWDSSSVSSSGRRKTFSTSTMDIDGQQYLALIFSGPPKLIKVL